jgi:ribosome maturation factor RimP
MLLNDPADPVFQDLDQFFRGLGHNLVDLGMRSKNGTTSVHLVLHSPSGLGIDDLSKAHRLLLPRLETLLQTEDISVELGSPGLERNLKYRRELGFYVGKKMKLYLAGASDWEEGLLTALEGDTLTFETKAGSRPVAVDQIHKAKLHDL